MSREDFKPIVKNINVDINDLFFADYSLFKNDHTFIRPANAWRRLPEKEFQAPLNNLFLSQPYNNGVEFGCYEHVSVCIGGNSDYILTTPTGTDEYNWTFGVHNLENGWGYLPKQQFTRVFHNNYETCCIVQRPSRDASIVYKFEILKEDTILNKNINFAHVAYGAVSIGDQVYTQQANIYNLTENTRLSFAGESIVILGYTI
jgi:hypothetical protein